MVQLSNDRRDIIFYQGQIKTAEFFINTALPPSLSKMDILLEGDETVTEFIDAAFRG